MSGAIAEVHWFPTHDDRFVTWGSEINLYQVKSSDDVEPNVATNINLSISSATTAILLAAETRYQYIRCVAPSFRRNGDLTLAVGLANGKVGLCNFVASTENNVEFTPKQSRPCVCLAWHEHDTNLLAIGHDRNRSDHCITICDTERGIPKEKAISNLIGLSETAHSLCWDKQSRVLVAGMSHKYIRVIDFRHASPLISGTNTRAVHGLSMAPDGRLVSSFIDNQVLLWDLRNIDKPLAVHTTEKNVSALSWCATRQSTLSIVQRDVGHVQLLDLHGAGRTGDEPFSIKRVIAPFAPGAVGAFVAPGALSGQLQSPGAILAAATTAGLSFAGSSSATASRGVTLSAVSWHPTAVERMLALSGSGQLVDFTVQQRVAIAFDVHNNLCGSLGMNMRCLRQSQTHRRARMEAATALSTLTLGAMQSVEAIEVAAEWSGQQTLLGECGDVMDLFYRRAANDYGKLHDLQRNGNLAENDDLVAVWNLLAHIGNTSASANATATHVTASRQEPDAPGPAGFAGLCEILGISSGRDAPPMFASDTCLLYWPEYPAAPGLKVFRNDARQTAQQLCGWSFDANRPETVHAFGESLCAAGDQHTRAAWIVCMQQQVGWAIELLQLGAEQSADETHLQLAAMGLSGLSFDKDNKWRAQCKAVRKQLKDPYLRALFAFLTPDADPNFDSILHESAISVSDRVAFACQFMCDARLAEFIKRMIRECHEAGNLCGLLLTGARPAGVALLQSFIDRHEDVQTAALIAVKFLPAELLAGDQVRFWTDSYRELLDVWGMWEHRAHFDITVGQLRSAAAASPAAMAAAVGAPARWAARSVFLLCSFCGKSVSACLAEESRQRGASANVNKMSSCPNCRKPLPRCSLCLLHMGTTATAAWKRTPPLATLGGSSSPLLRAPDDGGAISAALGCGESNLLNGQSRPFARWFSWCQSCRHGGHTEHLAEWFELHSECPVASCSCRCFALDVAVPAYNSSVTSVI